MVKECFANSRFDEAVNTCAFFEDMCSKKFIIPDILIYRIFLDAYANGSRFDDAERMANLTVDANLKCIAKFCPLD
ncbi:hypothetical protein Bca52824_042598 [Brassica carinata]|uniref:Pentatricopeptide repeat-containing protein n=1 Tax=Brassica carinata TaxID=52824 RepID=A0A8X7S1W6_BRACI|nr:hypothetical protein Bca52824_042598 [Brassica carinata]